jgi:uncharacterized membrane protein HdeD (DUF308 family)
MANTTRMNLAGATDARTGSGWQRVWGILLIMAGILALLMPGVAALATALVFGWLLVFSGIFEIAYAFQTRTHAGFGWKLAAAILTLVLGLGIVILPPAGIASLALLVGAFLFAGGIAVLTGFTLIASGVWRIILRHARIV